MILGRIEEDRGSYRRVWVMTLPRVHQREIQMVLGLT